MIQIDTKDAAPPQPAQVPACWAWRQCPGNNADRCACKLAACLPGRSPRFGDYSVPRPFTKSERSEVTAGRNHCANFRRRA